jgi:hypothetical protein
MVLNAQWPFPLLHENNYGGKLDGCIGIVSHWIHVQDIPDAGTGKAAFIMRRLGFSAEGIWNQGVLGFLDIPYPLFVEGAWPSTVL